MPEWYQLDIQEALSELNSSLDGISQGEAAQRLAQHGPNELVERGVKSPWAILWSQFTETMVVILIVAAVVSGLLGDLEDTVAIVAIVILNALLGFRQEYQAEKAMAALKKLAVPHVRVKRGGHVHEISAKELVPGDVVLLEAGNMLPADGRLIESANLRLQEAALTGESEPVSKEVHAQPGKTLPLADRHNMVYMGTVVTYGRGAAVITQTGMRTELGGIAEMMQSAKQEDTPLQKRLDQLGKGLAGVAIFLVLIIAVLGWLRGEEFRVLFLTSISIAVAAVPEGLPAVVTIALAMGARRMLKRRALIRKLPAVETLGSVTIICSDKTGTLTENRMTVTVLDVAEHHIDLTEDEMRKAMTGRAVLSRKNRASKEQNELLHEHPSLALLLLGGALANDALLEFEEDDPESLSIVGDPTEGALVVAAAQLGLEKDPLEKALPRLAEVPFDSDRKRMSTIHQMPTALADVPESLRPLWSWQGWGEQGKFITLTKGGIDSLLNVTDRVWVEDHAEPLNDHWRGRIEQANARLAQKGMRVLGVAFRPLESVPQKVDAESVENGLIFVGMVGMIDPARPEVKDAVQTCRDAGIRPMMITGDHPLTARHIAGELGISVEGEVITGQALDKMDNQELEKTVSANSVYARVSPEHKLKIVQALQNLGHIAAMTGDGVNDAPALKKADIGVAMGITGTDVSKEASDMVLLDDNFATIVAAVEEGRVIYDNIRKFIKYALTSNTGEIWIMLLSPFLGMPLALLPLQILWINLVTDGLPGLALGVERPEPNTMRRPPYPPNENIFARGVGRDILLIGFLIGALSLGVGYIYWSQANPAWQTMVFSTIVLAEMGYVMSIRSNRYSLFQIGPLSNLPLIGAVLLTTVLQLAVIYVPFLQSFFETKPLRLQDLAIASSVGIITFVVVEIQKWFIRLRNPDPVK